MPGRQYLEHALAEVDVLRDIAVPHADWSPPAETDWDRTPGAETFVPAPFRGQTLRQEAAVAGWRAAAQQPAPAHPLDISWAIN